MNAIIEHLDWPSLVVGGILGVVLTGLWKSIRDFLFGVFALKKLKGRYIVYLKDGSPFLGISQVKIHYAKMRRIKFKIFNDKSSDPYASGDALFHDRKHGRGSYTHINDDYYGTYELIRRGNEIMALRRYTTDKATNSRDSSEVVETSFIWKKIES